jgi:prepilin-type N-terminal cleavage/methylation domain-containing protein
MKKGITNYELRIKNIKNSYFLLLTSYLDIKNRGFSLIELLVVVSLFGIVGYLTTSIFIIGFRAQAKSEIMKEVKQTGDYAMQVMEDTIKNSIDVITPVPVLPFNSNSGIIAINPDGNTTTFLCSPTDYKISSTNKYPLPTPEITNDITNRNVIVKDCKFKIISPPSILSSKYVIINYTVCQKGCESSTDLPVENKASLPYQSTISLRIYK